MFGGNRVLWAIALGGAIAFTTTAASVEGKTATAAQLDRAVAANTGLALGFVENRGQANPRVRYYAQGDRYAFSATRDALLLSFVKAKRAAGIALALRFLGHDPAARPEGASRAPGEVNYFHGADPSRWRTTRPALPRGRLPRPLARHRPARARAGRRAQVRVPRAARRAAVATSASRTPAPGG